MVLAALRSEVGVRSFLDCRKVMVRPPGGSFGYLVPKSQIFLNVGRCNLTWLNLVRSRRGFDGADDGFRVVVEGGAGVQDVVASLDGDAAVAA